jgi:hypothetical protein
MLGKISPFPPNFGISDLGGDVIDGEVKWRVRSINKPNVKGVLTVPPRTNKCTCRKANPTDTTNITLAGDAAATLTVVDDTTALAAAGLSNVCTSGKVYKLDNSGGTAIAWANVYGSAGNTNSHCATACFRTTGSGGGTVAINGYGANYKSESGYESQTVIKATSAAEDTLQVYAQAGTVVYFILPQLEEGPTCSPPIFQDSDLVDGLNSITRGGTVITTDTDDCIRSNNVAFMGEIDLAETTQDEYATIISSYGDASNYFRIYFRTIYNNIYIGKIISGTPTSCSAYYGTTGATKFQYQTYLSSTTGFGIRCRWFIDGAWSSWTTWDTDSNTQDIPLGTTLDIGHLNGSNQLYGYHKWHRTWFHMNPQAFLEGIA